MAPEMLTKNIGHSFASDVWSLGVVMFTMLVGTCPFEANSIEATYRKIKTNSYLFPRIIPIADDVQKLIKKIFKLKPTLRPNLIEIEKDEFFNSASSKTKIFKSESFIFNKKNTPDLENKANHNNKENNVISYQNEE